MEVEETPDNEPSAEEENAEDDAYVPLEIPSYGGDASDHEQEPE